MVKLIEMESRMAAARGSGQRGVGSYWSLGTEFRFCEMKRAIEMDGGW